MSDAYLENIAFNRLPGGGSYITYHKGDMTGQRYLDAVEPDDFRYQNLLPYDEMLPQQNKGFSLKNAAKHFFQGAIVDTVKSFFSLPGLATMGAAAGLIWVTGGFAAIPLAVLGAGLGALQIVKSSAQAIEHNLRGNNAAAEESFRGIGSGAVASIFAYRGLRGILKNPKLQTSYQTGSGDKLQTITSETSAKSFGQNIRHIIKDILGKTRTEGGKSIYGAGKDLASLKYGHFKQRFGQFKNDFVETWGGNTKTWSGFRNAVSNAADKVGNKFSTAYDDFWIFMKRPAQPAKPQPNAQAPGSATAEAAAAAKPEPVRSPFEQWAKVNSAAGDTVTALGVNTNVFRT